MPSTRKVWRIFLTAAGVGYPLFVYFALPLMSPRLLLVPALALISMRVFGASDFSGNWAAATLLLAGLVLLILGVLVPYAAVRAYPVVMSLATASVFGLSLVRGPSLLERLARRTTFDLPFEAVRYTWRVTLIWCLFLTANAAIAAVIALCGTLKQWTLWNGLLFYLAAGLLFSGEYVVRRYVTNRSAQ
jgi:uncharacterized membrane protein